MDGGRSLKVLRCGTDWRRIEYGVWVQGSRIKALRQMHGRGELATESSGMMAKRDAGWGQTGRVVEGLIVVRKGFWTGGNGGIRWGVSSYKICFMNTLFKFFL